MTRRTGSHAQVRLLTSTQIPASWHRPAARADSWCDGVMAASPGDEQRTAPPDRGSARTPIVPPARPSVRGKSARGTLHRAEPRNILVPEIRNERDPTARARAAIDGPCRDDMPVTLGM